MAIKDNKFARRAKERREKSRVIGAYEEPTIEDRLKRLEEDIRRLKIEFDIYFNGGTKRPPYDTRMRVESHLKRLGDDRTLNFAQRYHYNSLATRYASFRELWRRIMQGREEGRDVAAAARASSREAGAPFTRSEFSCADVRHDVRTVKGVYDKLIEAKRSCGETTRDLSFAKFHRLMMERTENLKSQIGTKGVVFSIDVEGGHVSFKAKGER
ncbi:MAG TPA: MXAN_5187 C-terminal domain-containing protein [Pyrinomonadaceae bacterium]|nr:MXAN_5187 C-terminal domain-containing protein [Pyrinomonadaceae bacterium]